MSKSKPDIVVKYEMVAHWAHFFLEELDEMMNKNEVQSQDNQSI